MYNTSRNENYQPDRGGVLLNDENYLPVKLKHRSTGHTKWMNLHSDEPTVQYCQRNHEKRSKTKPMNTRESFNGF